MRRALATAVAAIAVSALLPFTRTPVAQAIDCTVTVRLAPGASSSTTAAAVACLEQRLLELGYDVGTPNSLYGTASVNAVKDFQRSRGLYPDGLVTSITGRQLGLRGALPPAGAPKVTVIGDSTSAAMRWYDEAKNSTAIYDVMGKSYDLMWSIESCKRLMAKSCVGRTDPGTGLRWTPVSVLPEMRGSLQGRLGDALVVMAGYDDYPSIADDIDAIMAEATAQGVSRVFWLTFRSTSAYSYGVYYRQHNQTLLAARTRHPNLVVLDWNAYTHRQSAATQRSWFARDGIHLTAAGGMALAKWLKANIDLSDAPRCAASRATGGEVPAPGSAAPADPTLTGFTPVPVQRVYDNRLAGPKIGAGRAVTIDLSGSAPAGASYVALHLNAVQPCGTGDLRAYACDAPPATGQVAFEAGRTTSGTQIVRLSPTGTVCVQTSAATDLVADVSGWFGSGGDGFVRAAAPWRLLDSKVRSTPVVIAGPLAPGRSVTVTLPADASVPAGASAAWLNVFATATGSSSSVVVRAGACGATSGGVTVSAFRGRTASSAVLVGLGARSFCITAGTAGAVHVVVDVWGAFVTDPAALFYRSVTAAPVSAAASPGVPMVVPAAGPPAGVAVIAAITSSGNGSLVLTGCEGGATRTLLKEQPGEVVANAGIAPVGASGSVCATSTAATTLTAVQTGEFLPIT